MSRKGERWIVHVNATCQDCGKEFDDHTKPNAPADHARKFKHRVTGEIAYAFEYKGQGKW